MAWCGSFSYCNVFGCSDTDLTNCSQCISVWALWVKPDSQFLQIQNTEMRWYLTSSETQQETYYRSKNTIGVIVLLIYISLNQQQTYDTTVETQTIRTSNCRRNIPVVRAGQPLIRWLVVWCPAPQSACWSVLEQNTEQQIAPKGCSTLERFASCTATNNVWMSPS